MDETEGRGGAATAPAVSSDAVAISDEKRRQLLEKIRSRVSSAPIKDEFIDFQRFNQLYGDQNNRQGKPTTAKDDSQEPPQKRQKKSGQNKKRPRPKRDPPHTRLCLNVSMGKVCQYGVKCKFSHEVADLMKKKLPDIGPKCYNFDTFGRCPFGLMCRYGASHIGPDFENVVDESRVVDPASLTHNQLTLELKRSLRKKSAPFPKSEAYLQTLPRKGRGKKKEAHDTLVANTPPSDCVKSKPLSGKVLDNSISQTSESVIRTNSEGEVPPAGVTTAQPEVLQDSGKTSPEVGSSVSNEGILQDSSNVPVIQNGGSDSIAVSRAPSAVGSIPETSEAIPIIPAEGAETVKTPSPIKLIEEDQSVVSSGIVDPGANGQMDMNLSETVNGPREKKSLDVDGKLLLAPLTTVGNLPFRRICKRYGADITCGEMAMCTNLLMGQACEWALLRRHHTEDVFGVQLCGAFPDTMTKCAELLSSRLELDFIDINVGCPIDLVYHKGAGTGLMNRMPKFEQIVRGMSSVMDIPLSVKLRTGVLENKNMAHTVIPKLYDWGASVVTVHGRSREARYTRSADWGYLKACAQVAQPHPFIGNGDILSFEDANDHFKNSGSAGLMIARGALIKPWIFTEIKEQRHWDISSGERLDLLRDFSNYGLEHWGSDSQGVEKTRRFLLEWLSFLHRYIPVGLLERLPQRINERPPYYIGRNDLETMMASANCEDWVKISEMLLGPIPDDFIFLPKHKANSYK